MITMIMKKVKIIMMMLAAMFFAAANVNAQEFQQDDLLGIWLNEDEPRSLGHGLGCVVDGRRRHSLFRSLCPAPEGTLGVQIVSADVAEPEVLRHLRATMRARRSLVRQWGELGG